jgi:NTP pyrophosphatase (non-canonical NTP hydrolase)
MTGQEATVAHGGDGGGDHGEAHGGDGATARGGGDGGRAARDEAGAAAARAPGDGLLELMAVMARLRRECPWDAEQTHESLAPHLLEESYEAIDALQSGDPDAVREELGDVLLQVYFHAEVASERSDGTGYTVDDVADGIAAKLIRRHPHVFGDVSVTGPDEVKLNWDAIKAAERQAKNGGPGSVLDGVPFGQPALALAAQLQRRAQRAGVPDDLADLTAGAESAGAGAGASGAESAGAGAESAGAGAEGGGAEGGGAASAGAAGGGAAGAGAAPSELGAELFALVARARAAGLDPELELRAAARVYRDRVQAWEEQARRP